jgi:hypothetical protein
MSEVVSSGPDRLIVYEGAEERLVQVTVGFLERVGLGKASWERKNEYAPPAPIRTENQLPSGQQTPLETPAIRQPQRASEPLAETWDEDNWEPVEVRQSQPPQKARLYVEDEPEDNWSTASSTSPRSPYEQPEDDYEDENYDNVELADVVDAINPKVVNRSVSGVSAVEIIEVVEELSDSDADPWADPKVELSSEVAVEAPLPDDALPNDETANDDRPVLNIPEKVKESQE